MRPIIKFSVLGEPQGKGRPRFASRKSKSGKIFTSTYTPAGTVAYEGRVKEAFRLRYPKQIGLEKGFAIAVLIDAYYGIPASASHKAREDMLNGVIRPTKKPDADNVGKIICDALNGLVYHDDSQIVDLHERKFYSNQPRVDVKIIPAYLLNEKARKRVEMEEAQCKIQLL